MTKIGHWTPAIVTTANGRHRMEPQSVEPITAGIHSEPSEEILKASNRFLIIANRHSEMAPLLGEFIDEIKEITECDAVGVRILDDEGNIPYQAYCGFSQEFYEQENALCIKSDECMCVNVVRGTIDSKNANYSKGSFFLNSTTAFINALEKGERKKIRGVCNAYGYESLALIPISMGRRILGLIHVADRRPNQLPEQIVNALENVAMQLGAAIQRIKAEEELRMAYGNLEIRVKERTATLTRINEQLRQEIEDRKKTEAALKLNESRLEAIHQLSQMGTSSLKEICDFAVEEGVRLTQSEYGYLFFMNEDETILTVHSWSKEAMAVCTVHGKPEVYWVVETGLWGEAVRQRKPIITNKYLESALRKGIPEGHVPIRSHMNIPVFDRDRIVAVAGVANKKTDYVENDVRQLQLLMKGMWRHIQRKRAREALQESEKKLRFLSNQLLVAQEKERKRIAHELHDELGQALLTLKLQLRSIFNQLGNQQLRLKAEFEYVFRHINIVTENVRRLSKDLSPSILEDLGLIAALNGLIQQTSKHNYIDIKSNLEELDGWFTHEQELIVFRVVQEALTNVAKHARSRMARIDAKRKDDRLILIIEDQGVGFDVEKVKSRRTDERGLGLAAMDERVHILGGRLNVYSSKGEGTRIFINIPLQITP